MIAFVYRNWHARDRGRLAFADRPDIEHLTFGCSMMGRRFRLVVMLDNPRDTDSVAQAEYTMDWYNCQLLTRLVPDGKIIDAWEGAA